jgi:hypothetical protein
MYAFVMRNTLTLKFHYGENQLNSLILFMVIYSKGIAIIWLPQIYTLVSFQSRE